MKLITKKLYKNLNNGKWNHGKGPRKLNDTAEIKALTIIKTGIDLGNLNENSINKYFMYYKNW